jgi:hypothetical protein
VEQRLLALKRLGTSSITIMYLRPFILSMLADNREASDLAMWPREDRYS